MKGRQKINYLATKIVLVAVMLLPLLGMGKKATTKPSTTAPVTFTLNVSNERIGDVLDAITLQTKVEFAYSTQFVDTERRVNINASNKLLYDGLKELFPDCSFMYGGQRSFIFISPNCIAKPIAAESVLDKNNSSLMTESKNKSPKTVANAVALMSAKDSLDRINEIEEIIRANVRWHPIAEKGIYGYKYESVRKDGEWKPLSGSMTISGRVITLVDSTNRSNNYRLIMGETKRDTMDLGESTLLVNDHCIVDRIDVLNDRKHYMFKFTHDLKSGYYWITLNDWNNPVYKFLFRVKPIK